MNSPLLVFTTDFGLADPYAGVMKGVALSINPDLRLIDLTHQIMPQSIAQGSFLLGINHRYFPKDAIHVAVVDPGVGTDRRPVLLSTPWGVFVAPDNGLLSGVIGGYLDSTPVVSGPVPLPTSIRRFCVIRSPHIHKDSREHFELRTHNRLIDILEPTSKTIDSLTRLNVPAGVDISIKL